VPRDSEISLKVFEPADAEKRVAEYEHRPAVADHRE